MHIKGYIFVVADNQTAIKINNSINKKYPVGATCLW